MSQTDFITIEFEPSIQRKLMTPISYSSMRRRAKMDQIQTVILMKLGILFPSKQHRLKVNTLKISLRQETLWYLLDKRRACRISPILVFLFLFEDPHHEALPYLVAQRYLK